MWRLRQKLAYFMYGRYGIDRLYWVLFGVWATLSVVNIFLNLRVIYLLELGVMVFSFFRVFSKNIYRRRKENDWFLRVTRRVVDFIKLQFSRIRDIGKKRYRRCPACHSVLRLPIKHGKHSAKCPRCFKVFTVKIVI